MNIPLSPVFAPSVLAGKKRSTIRRGRRDYPPGEALLLAGQHRIPVRITGCRYSSFDTLTDHDAQMDGLNSLHELRHTLVRFYPSIKPDELVTIVEFELRTG